MHNDDQRYYYVRNLLGDVTAIVNESGATVATYAYDPWGKCTILSDSSDINVATQNPIRYRGYYYDNETALYYLQSRYYDPETGRFISPDSTEYLEPSNFNGLNLYAYCGNNPVMCVDPSGHMPEWLGNMLKGVAIIAGTALVVTALTFTGGTAAAFLIAAGKAALVGLEIAAVAGATSGLIRTGRSLVKNISEGNSFSETVSNAGKSFLEGFGDGFLSGAEYYLSTALISVGVYPFLGLCNNGAGIIKPTYMAGYQNPNVLGITFYASRTGSRFRLDLDPEHSIHYHKGKTKAERAIHKGSWIGGILAGICAGFNGEVY